MGKPDYVQKGLNSLGKGASNKDHDILEGKISLNFWRTGLGDRFSVFKSLKDYHGRREQMGSG